MQIPKILALLEEGQSLRKACEEVGVKAPTFMDWVKADEQLAEHYARAKEHGIELMAEEILEIADDASLDMKSTENGIAVDYEHIQRSKLRVDARKWLLSKQLPKKYGDKLDLTSGDKPLPAPVIRLYDGSKREADPGMEGS